MSIKVGDRIIDQFGGSHTIDYIVGPLAMIGHDYSFLLSTLKYIGPRTWLVTA